MTPKEVSELLSNNLPKTIYVGRFAPSPTGPLHFGSLVCALASYLHAKQHQGKWLVRIEDVDTTRANSNMVSIILESLKAHGLVWDEPVSFQSQRFKLYERYLKVLKQQNKLYGCICTRKEIKQRGKVYDSHCLNKQLALNGNAIRFKHTQSCIHPKQRNTIQDLFWGKQLLSHPMCNEDPVLKRADGIYAYHIAVVVDDIEQGVNHIIRGVDLLDTTPVHLALYRELKHTIPRYMHIPLIAHEHGQKLSKQNLALAIDNSRAYQNLTLALQCLGIDENAIPSGTNTNTSENIENLLQWAVEHWSYKMMPNQREVLISTTNGVYSKLDNKNKKNKE